MQLSNDTMQFGRDLTTALLGVDATYRRESGDDDGLAVLNLDEAGEFQPEPFSSYQEARLRFEDLTWRATKLPEPDRRTYYHQVCHSTLAFITWRSTALPFTAQLADFLHVLAAPASEPELDQLRTEMRTLLGRLGYHGDLAVQCADWEERHRVPAADVPAVLTELMSEAWDRTEARLLSIPAPKSDGMQIAAVTGVAFNARCNYRHRQVEINTDPILTRPGLKHLAVHEGYPGHYVQFTLRHQGYLNGTSPADGLLSVVNTASSAVFEGIADHGMAMLDWLEGNDDRLQSLMTRYRSGIGTGAAWRLHALGQPPAAVADWLRTVALTGGEGWIANRMSFIAAPARAVLIWSYWWGEPAVAAAWHRVAPSRRPEFLEFLYGRMHSTVSVGMFQ